MAAFDIGWNFNQPESHLHSVMCNVQNYHPPQDKLVPRIFALSLFSSSFPKKTVAQHNRNVISVKTTKITSVALNVQATTFQSSFFLMAEQKVEK